MTETEQTAIDLFTEKYGKDLFARFDKLDEEYNELREALEDYKNHLPGSREHLIDELSDVSAVKTHICGLLGVSNDKLLTNAIIKVKIREVNPYYMKEIKEENVIPEKKELTLDYILERTCSFYGYEDIADCITDSRKKDVVKVRQQYCYIAKEATTKSLSVIGSKIGNRDHATVMHAIKQVNNLLQTDKKYRDEFIELRNKVLGITPVVFEPM
ncbi:MAG: hypothetical protein JXQ69_01325 [Paludibacteraceae bacterium]|nr:hypothetical protein [Paludibacteraceae bacterium]